MWLVLCDASDASAVWVCQEMRSRGVAPLELLTADDLALADYWEHRIGKDRTRIRFRAGALDIDGERLHGVLNRLYTVPVPHWQSKQKSDRDYVQQELVALFLSWLHGLPCPIINRPTPQGLSGQWRCESEWIWLARQAGLAVAPYRQSSDDRIDEMKGERRLIPAGAAVQTVIVAGDAAPGAAAPPPVIAGCKRLARIAGTELLGVDFIAGAAGPWTFAGASPMPYLTPGGAPLIELLCELLAMPRVAA
jgi:hypothetical protein